VQVEGLANLLQRLARLGADVQKELEAAASCGAEVIKDRANELAPGPHIDTEVEESSRDSVTVAIGPIEEKWHYRFFELGAAAHEVKGGPLAFEGREGTVVTGRVRHPGMAARPFLRPALDTREDQAIEAVEETLKARIDSLR